MTVALGNHGCARRKEVSTFIEPKVVGWEQKGLGNVF
jgi:hypothetical protein